MNELKLQLYSFCREYIEKSINEIEAAIADRRDAMKNETKSSMGDKYETTREMLQQGINMNMQRLSKAKTDQAILYSVDPELLSDIIVHGSLVYADSANYYIAIGAGSITVSGNKYYTVSPDAPISQQLLGKKKSDTITINGKSIAILNVV